MPKNTTIYTIGHSSHSIEDFLALLQQHGIERLVEVRSQPYSRWAPQFNRQNLAAALAAANIDYVDLGASLGGRPQDRALYDPGNERPDYERQRKSELYLEGLAALRQQAASARTAMMCSEGDPDDCHRTLLITPDLLDLGDTVQHILPDGLLRQAEKRAQQLGFDF